jgi:hypothetical protein
VDRKSINFDSPTEVRTLEKGRFELDRVGPMSLGRATYEPGWNWAEHLGPATGESSCKVRSSSVSTVRLRTASPVASSCRRTRSAKTTMP